MFSTRTYPQKLSKCWNCTSANRHPRDLNQLNIQATVIWKQNKGASTKPCELLDVSVKLTKYTKSSIKRKPEVPSISPICFGSTTAKGKNTPVSYKFFRANKTVRRTWNWITKWPHINGGAIHVLTKKECKGVPTRHPKQQVNSDPLEVVGGILCRSQTFSCHNLLQTNPPA